MLAAPTKLGGLVLRLQRIESAFRPQISPCQKPRWFTSRSEASEEDVATTRNWLKTFGSSGGLPSDVGEVSYSRSSGPGGQNVNK